MKGIRREVSGEESRRMVQAGAEQRVNSSSQSCRFRRTVGSDAEAALKAKVLLEADEGRSLRLN